MSENHKPLLYMKTRFMTIINEEQYRSYNLHSFINNQSSEDQNSHQHSRWITYYFYNIYTYITLP